MLARYINYESFMDELQTNLSPIVGPIKYIGILTDTTHDEDFVLDPSLITQYCESLYITSYKTKVDNDIAGIELYTSITGSSTTYYIYHNKSWVPITNFYTPNVIYNNIYTVKIDIKDDKLYVNNVEKSFDPPMCYSKFEDYVNSWETYKLDY